MDIGRGIKSFNRREYQTVVLGLCWMISGRGITEDCAPGELFNKGAEGVTEF